jgi:hypothetical protein
MASSRPGPNRLGIPLIPFRFPLPHPAIDLPVAEPIFNRGSQRQISGVLRDIVLYKFPAPANNFPVRGEQVPCFRPREFIPI